MCLKFKNRLNLGVLSAGIFTAWIIVACAIACLLAYLFGEATDYVIVLIVCSSVILGLWLIVGLFLLLNGTVVITDSEIKICNGKKVKWSIQKEEIEECRYNKLKWHHFILPFGIENVFLLQFKLNGKGVSRKSCSLSLKQVKQIRDKFDYLIKIV